MVEREDGVPLYSQYMEVNSISQSVQDRYLRLTNGIFLNEVMRVIDPNPKVERLYNSESDDQMLRVQNFSILNRHLRAFYQEDLQQLILMPLPNVAILGQDPLTEAAVEELRRLLLLLLGCAVQCENKETFIQQIQSLDIETQAGIASCIQQRPEKLSLLQVTQDPRMVLPLQWEELVEVEGADLQLVFSSMAKQIQSMLAQRDTHLQRIAELCREREAQADSTMAPLGGHSKEPPQGLALQLADSKAKLRRLKQQLEDKGDQILDYKLEIETMEEQLKKLQKEEQQQLCAALQETKVLLEEQLADARARCSSMRELERDNLLLRHRIIDVEARDTEKQRVDELLEMNMTLEADLRHCSSSGGDGGSVPASIAAVHHRFLQSELDSDEELSKLIDQKPLSVEVGEASTLRLLGAEQENAELRRRLEELQAQQEAESPQAKDELTSLETEHQNTLREFQNLKNENTTLKQRLEQLVTKLQHIEDKTKDERVKKSEGEEAEKEERGLQGSEYCRGEGEGTVRMIEEKERRGEIIGTQREAGVGEEILHVHGEKAELCNDEIKSKRRGEAEGGQKEREKQEKENELKIEQTLVTSSEILNHPKSREDNTETTAADQAIRSLSGPDVELLTTQLQEAQEEADRQAMVAQDLRFKLGEQSRKAWEAEQRMVLLEAELQHLKKAAESLGEARRQIEVLQSDGLAMEEELCRLRSQAELHRMQTTVIATLEGERAALERDKDTLRSTVDALRTAQRKGEQLELTTQTLRAELERQGRSLETSRRREEELEADLRERCVSVGAGWPEEGGEAEGEGGSETEAAAGEHDHGPGAQQPESSGSGRRTQDLSNKQARSNDLSTEVERLRLKLQKAEAELKGATNSLNQSEERIKSLSDCVKKSESLLQLEKRRKSTDTEVTSNSNSDLSNESHICHTQIQETSPVDQSPAASKGRDLSMTHDYTVGETERQLSERLMELEKEKAVAVAEQEALLSRLSQSQEACKHLQEQLEALRRHSLSLQDSCTQLQTLNTQLQVEQVSLSSQHAVVLTRCSESEARCAALEAESKVWTREREESAARMEALRRDNERMTVLQQRQEVELEELLDKHSQLRSNNRILEVQHRELEARYKELLDSKTHLEEREREMKMEREKMEAEAQKRMERERELERLKDDNERLQAQQKEGLASQAELLAQGSELRGELSASQLERTRLEGELSVLRETNQNLDLNNVRLTSQYQGEAERASSGEAEVGGEDHGSVQSPRAQHAISKQQGQSHTEPDISVPGTPVLRSGSGGRRKLGSRHGWGLGLARGGSGVSQSFSPGDQKTPPRWRLRSSQNNSTVLWEGEIGETNTPKVAETSQANQENIEEDYSRDNQPSSDDTRRPELQSTHN
ncbi:hypothetical protein PAMP_023808 [Pampus punctatissimus]